MPQWKIKKLTKKAGKSFQKSVAKDAVAVVVATPKRKRTKKSTMAPQTIRSIVPTHKFTSFKYRGSFQISTVAYQNNVTYYIRANSLYRPDYGGGTRGGTVDGYTLASTIYNSYRCYGAKIRATASNTAGVVPCTWVISASTDNSTAAYPTSKPMGILQDRDGAISKCIQGYGQPKAVQTMSKYYKFNEVYGKTKSEWNTDPNTLAIFGNSPSNGVWFAFSFGQVPEASVTPVTLAVEYELTIYAQLLDIKEAIMDA